MKKTDFHNTRHILNRVITSAKIDFDGLSVEVIFKVIKNIHIKICPPNGNVRVSVPAYMNIQDVKSVVLSKLDRIRQVRRKIQQIHLKSSQQFEDGETHYIWGNGYILSVEEKQSSPSVKMDGRKMILTVRPKTDINKKKDIMEAWYRKQIREESWTLIKKWEEIIGVRVEKLFIRKMKTRWGSCNVTKHTIRLNTLLAIKPLQYLECIIVHEMTHLLEPSHNNRFKGLMDTFLPEWRQYQRVLNQNPLM